MYVYNKIYNINNIYIHNIIPNAGLNSNLDSHGTLSKKSPTITKPKSMLAGANHPQPIAHPGSAPASQPPEIPHQVFLATAGGLLKPSQKKGS